jgi:23S rRNA G2445 N2-methylase RlmL
MRLCSVKTFNLFALIILLKGVATLWLLFGVVNGLEKVASLEISEKLDVAKLVFFPYGPHGWIKCEIKDYSLNRVRNLRSIGEAHIIVREESYSDKFSLDRFADIVMEKFHVYAPHAQRISVSAYSVRGRPSQREIQGAFSKRIAEKLNAECNLRNYDAALRISLLKRAALATIDLEIRPGNIPKIETHPTPLLPQVAYCMIRLTSPKDGEQLLDPMCGCGTIPLVAALEWGKLKITGSDLSDDCIKCARRNAETLGIAEKVKLITTDVANLKEETLEADIIAVNPPYSISVRTKGEVGRTYNTLFDKAARILSDKGRMAIVTPYPQTVVRLASKWMFKISSIHYVGDGGLQRAIHIIQKP